MRNENFPCLHLKHKQIKLGLFADQIFREISWIKLGVVHLLKMLLGQCMYNVRIFAYHVMGKILEKYNSFCSLTISYPKVPVVILNYSCSRIFYKFTELYGTFIQNLYSRIVH
jgi:hypothetical protein